MTRKRFIKLLMSHGESKHRAQAIAYLYNRRNKPYKSAYSDYVLKKSLRVACWGVGGAFAKVGLALKNMIQMVERLKQDNTEDVDNAIQT